MARTLVEIKAAMVAKKEAESALDGLTSDSAVAEWNLWLDLVAFCTLVLEQLFDLFKTDVTEIVRSEKAHTLAWYVTKAKAYQHGVSLPADTDVYAVVPPVDEAVLIVAAASATESNLNVIRVKAAKGEPGALEALSAPELTGLRAYMKRIKDAGVRLNVTSDDPDDLKVGMRLYYNPLILDSDGARLDGTSDTPVKDAINAYLSNLPFNGEFSQNAFVDAIQAVEGVVFVEVLTLEANYGSTPYVPIPVAYLPDAGYMVLNDTYFGTHVGYFPHEL